MEFTGLQHRPRRLLRARRGRVHPRGGGIRGGRPRRARLLGFAAGRLALLRWRHPTPLARARRRRLPLVRRQGETTDSYECRSTTPRTTWSCVGRTQGGRRRRPVRAGCAIRRIPPAVAARLPHRRAPARRRRSPVLAVRHTRRRDTWRIGVLREPDGRGGSVWIHDTLELGATVRVAGPRNHFEFSPDRGTSYLFIAGGIGITPITADDGCRSRRRASTTRCTTRAARARRWRWSRISWPGIPARVTLHASDEGDRARPRRAVRRRCRRSPPRYCCGPARLIEAVEAAGAGAPAQGRALRAQGARRARARGAVRGRTRLQRARRSTVPPERSDPRGRRGGRGARALVVPRGHLRHVRDPVMDGRGRPPRLDPHAARAGRQRRHVHLRVALGGAAARAGAVSRRLSACHEVALVGSDEFVVAHDDPTRDHDVLRPAARVGPEQAGDRVGDAGVGDARDVPDAQVGGGAGAKVAELGAAEARSPSPRSPCRAPRARRSAARRAARPAWRAGRRRAGGRRRCCRRRSCRARP